MQRIAAGNGPRRMASRSPERCARQAHIGIGKSVPETVPELGQITIHQHPTSTKFVRKNRPEIRDSRPVSRSLVALANRRLQPLGHLTAARNLSIRHASTYAERVRLPAVAEHPNGMVRVDTLGCDRTPIGVLIEG